MRGDRDLLQQQIEDMQYAEHDAVAQRLQQARELNQEGNRLFDAGRRDEGLVTWQQEMRLLRQAIDISTRLARCLPRTPGPGNPVERDALGEESQVIVQRQAELAGRYDDIRKTLAAGRVEEAVAAIDARCNWRWSS